METFCEDFTDLQTRNESMLREQLQDKNAAERERDADNDQLKKENERLKKELALAKATIEDMQNNSNDLKATNLILKQSENKVTKLKEELGDAEVLAVQLQRKVKENQRCHEEEVVRIRYDCEMQLAEKVTYHTLETTVLKMDLEETQLSADSAVKELKDEVKELGAVKKEEISQIISDYEFRIQIIARNHNKIVHEMNKKVKSFIDDLQNGRQKCFTLRAPRSRRSKIIDRLEGFLENVD